MFIIMSIGKGKGAYWRDLKDTYNLCVTKDGGTRGANIILFLCLVIETLEQKSHGSTKLTVC